MSVPPDSIRIPLVSARVVRLAFLFSSSISPESNSGSKHRSLGWMPSNKGHDVNLALREFFSPTNFTLSEYLASKHFGDSACFGSKNLRDSANLLKILFKVDFICTIQKKAVSLQ